MINGARPRAGASASVNGCSREVNITFSSAPGNTNQWSAGTIAQGVSQFKISLTANYVQTAAAVTLGQANGRATFTLNYQ